MQDEDDYEATLTDYLDVQLFAEIQVGQPVQAVQVIVDTGSDWFWVATTQCDDCGGDSPYDRNASTTFNQTDAHMQTYTGKDGIERTEELQAYLAYGSGSVYGYYATESMCLSTDSENEPICVEDFQSIFVKRQTGLSMLMCDGILGLGPTMGTNPVDGKLFIEQAYDTGVIDEKIFSLSIQTEKLDSYLTVGGYDLDQYAQSDLSWHNVVENGYWSLPFEGMFYGDQIIHKSPPNDTIIVDSGTSYFLMPPTPFNAFIAKLVRLGINCWPTETGGMYFISCNCRNPNSVNRFEDINLVVDNVQYTIPVDRYVERYDDGECGLKILSLEMSTDMWILGLNFFHEYYTIFDQGEKRIGFAQSLNGSNAPTAFEGSFDDYIETSSG